MAVSAPEYRFPYYRNHGFLVQEYSVTQDGMIAMCLIMVIKSFALLFPISRKQRSVDIEKHELRLFDGIYFFAELTHDIIKLPERTLVHAVKEPGQRGL